MYLQVLLHNNIQGWVIGTPLHAYINECTHTRIHYTLCFANLQLQTLSQVYNISDRFIVSYYNCVILRLLQPNVVIPAITEQYGIFCCVNIGVLVLANVGCYHWIWQIFVYIHVFLLMSIDVNLHTDNYYRPGLFLANH